MSSYKRRRISGYASGGLKWGDIQAIMNLGGAYDNTTVTGYGAYKVRSNALYSGATVPYIRNSNIAENALVISHKEYIGDVVTSATPGAFTIKGFPINVGLARTFEWLTQIAMNYEQYVLEGLLFCFKSFSADALNSTNTALGNVIMATNYNPYNAPFADKAEMEGYEFSTSFKPSMSAIHPVECSPYQTPVSELYVRTGTAPSGADLRLYDLGTFYIATTGFQGASVNIGELWVTYQVALLKPKLYQALGLGEDAFRVAFSGNDNTNTLGTTQTIAYNNCGITLSATTIFFPQYPHRTRYYIRYSTRAAAAAAVPTIATAGATNAVQVKQGQAPDAATVSPNATSYFIVDYFGLSIQGSITISWSGAYGVAATNTGTLEIGQVPNDFYP